MRTIFSIPRLRGVVPRSRALAVIVAAALALSVGSAVVASAATTSASTPHVVASHATLTANAADEAEIVIGPVASFTSEEACVIFGESEFPPGSTFLGYVVVGSFCEFGPATPPLIGNAWNVFLLVEPPGCTRGSAPSHIPTDAAAARAAVRTGGAHTLGRTGVKVWIYKEHDTAASEAAGC